MKTVMRQISVRELNSITRQRERHMKKMEEEIGLLEVKYLISKCLKLQLRPRLTEQPYSVKTSVSCFHYSSGVKP